MPLAAPAGLAAGIHLLSLRSKPLNGPARLRKRMLLGTAGSPHVWAQPLNSVAALKTGMLNFGDFGNHGNFGNSTSSATMRATRPAAS